MYPRNLLHVCVCDACKSTYLVWVLSWYANTFWMLTFAADSVSTAHNEHWICITTELIVNERLTHPSTLNIHNLATAVTRWMHSIMHVHNHSPTVYIYMYIWTLTCIIKFNLSQWLLNVLWIGTGKNKSDVLADTVTSLLTYRPTLQRYCGGCVQLHSLPRLHIHHALALYWLLDLCWASNLNFTAINNQFFSLPLKYPPLSLSCPGSALYTGQHSLCLTAPCLHYIQKKIGTIQGMEVHTNSTYTIY